MKRLICLLLLATLLCGCTTAEQKSQQTIFCMDTVMDLQVWGPDSGKAVSELSTLLYTLEDTWSATDEHSLLSRLNRGEAQPSAAEQALLDRVCALSERTGGAFDPRLFALVSAWGFPTDEFRVPTEAELQEALAKKQWDLGGAVKGYAGAQAAELLASLDIDRAIVNLGGNIQTYGTKPDGSPWRIGIQSPDGSGYVGTLSVSGTAAIVTSGDYQRRFEKNGAVYHHILDPKTGYPADSGLRSVTVICRDGLTADALSTALFVMGLEDAVAHWRQSDDFEAVFILSSGQILATQGVTLTDCVYEVIGREN